MWIVAALVIGSPDLDTQLFRGTAAVDAYVTRPTARYDAQTLQLSAGFGYELDPIVVEVGGRRTDAIVPHRATIQIGVFAVPVRRLALFASAAHLWSIGAEPGIDRAAFGDLEGGAAFTLFTWRALTIAPSLAVRLPAATGALASEGGLRVLPGFAVEVVGARWSALLHAQLWLRPRADVGPDLSVPSEVNAVAAGRYAFDAFTLLAEVDVRGPLGDSSGAAPIELRLAAAHDLTPSVVVRGGLGAGLTNGYGAPVVRAFVALAFDWSPSIDGAGPPIATRAPEALEPEPSPPDSPAETLPDWLTPTPPAVARRLLCPRLGPAVRFDQDRADLTDEALVELARVAGAIQGDDSIYHVVVEGHASAEGDRPYNWVLSLRRAEAVQRFLVEAGVEASRVSIRGMGEAVPERERGDTVVPDDRRVVLCITRRLDVLDDEPEWRVMTPPWEAPP